ncbi:unnamed protein product, partial [Mesorhabditis belari]|uniref:DNA polymerase n=1 Tax=Mesorhabditis belari TaxID=2138241 RepID=A0AAF3FE59_9BILA
MDENDGITRRSSRRSAVDNKHSKKLETLKAIQEARRSGTSIRKHLDGSEVNDVYYTVDENEYEELLKNRQQDNFVEDDDGNGYVDHGVDFFEESDEEEEKVQAKKKAKKEKTKKGGITSFFTGLTNTNKPKIDESKVTLDVDHDLMDVLADFSEDEPVEERPFVSRNQFKRGRESSPPLAPKLVATRNVQLSNTLVRQSSLDSPQVKKSFALEPPMKKTCPESIPDSLPMDDGGFDDSDDYPGPSFDDQEPTPALQEVATQKNTENQKDMMEWPVEEETEAPEEPIEVNVGEEKFYQALEDKDAQGNVTQTPIIRFYWIDAFEDANKRPGTVYLFGKVEVASEHFESCCIVVENIYRKIYFIPRDTKMWNGVLTEIPVAKMDVYNEVKDLLKDKFDIINFKCAKESKKRLMNCENDGMPGEKMDVLEVHYSSSYAKIPVDTNGETFRFVANTTATAMERLLIETEMKGPGWMNIAQFVPATARISHCKYEFTVDMERMKNIVYLKDQPQQTPPLRMLALTVYTTLNNNRDNEISMISCRITNKCNINSTNVNPEQMQRLCFFAPPPGVAAPMDIRKRLVAEKLDSFVHQATNEKHLLNMFLSKLKALDVDLIIGHDAVSKVGKLIERLERLKIPNWHMMGRIRRSIPLKVGSSKTAQWEMTAGRLVLDIKNSAMELVRCKSYDLEDLAENLLKYRMRAVYPNEIPSFFANSDQLLKLIGIACREPTLAVRLANSLNALPLAFQITNVVGGVASRTLMGGRSERNEFHLLHAFYKNDMIPPDKFQSHFKHKGVVTEKIKVKTEIKEEPMDPESEINDTHLETEQEAKKKAQYSGGLVLDPKKGLYDTLILLLDFNSLYPSIIQEFNICFSTVNYVDKDGNDLPPLPSSSYSEGILPLELRGLVERRRQVKGLIKTAKTDLERQQFDIRQMALKLTANSMYGCLGFQQSRFYAKPLAALVTAKGREILMHTKELVEKIGYSVIYGDTDSIMINTNTMDLQLAKKLGLDIKKQVNQCHKLLELDLDGVFKRMLLLKKKKYAALVINLDDEKTKKEMKGLDIVRRDWSDLARHEGTRIVDLILDPKLSREELVAEIHDSLRSLRTKIDNSEVPIHDFEILKQLTRDPKIYGDAKALPHVTVARRLNSTGKFQLKQGDVVKYVICEDGTSNSATQRAYHLSELDAEGSNLKIDVHYYLANQLHPVISRLCEPIEEADAASIADALGLDPAQFKNRSVQRDGEWLNFSEESYDGCEAFKFVCSHCNAENVVDKIFKTVNGSVRLSVDSCSKCERPLASAVTEIKNSFEIQLDEFDDKMAKSPLKCDICDTESVSPASVSPDGTALCENPDCFDGVARKVYGEAQLYRQQKYFEMLVDVKRAQERLKNKEKDQPPPSPMCDTLTEMLRTLLGDRNVSQKRRVKMKEGMRIVYYCNVQRSSGCRYEMSVIVPNDKDAKVSIDDINEHSCDSTSSRRRRPKPTVTDLDKPLIKRNLDTGLSFLPTTDLSLAFLSSQLCASAQPVSPSTSVTSETKPGALVNINTLNPLPGSSDGLALFLNQMSEQSKLLNCSTPSPSDSGHPWQCVECEVVDFSRVSDRDFTHMFHARCTYSHFTYASPLRGSTLEEVTKAVSTMIYLYNPPERLRFDPILKTLGLELEINRDFPTIIIDFHTDPKAQRQNHTTLRQLVLGWLFEHGIRDGWADRLTRIKMEHNNELDRELDCTPAEKFFRRDARSQSADDTNTFTGLEPTTHDAFSECGTEDATDEHVSPEPELFQKVKLEIPTSN